jgi:hypothetical protein
MYRERFIGDVPEVVAAVVDFTTKAFPLIELSIIFERMIRCIPKSSDLIDLRRDISGI